MRVTPHVMLRAVAALALITVPVAAFGQGTEEQQQACTPDALKLCSDTIPDIGKTTACMKSKFSQLTPRCQAAFSDATGGGKTKTASRKAEPPKARVAKKAEEPAAGVATRAERRMPERSVVRREAPEAEDRAPPPHVDRDAALPPDTDPTLPPRIAGYPPFPSPNAPVVRAPSSARGQLVQACHDGLIDSFTCSTTVPALLGSSGY